MQGVSIEARDLWMPAAGGPHGFPPAIDATLDAADCIHCRLTFVVDGRVVAATRRGAPADACLRDWIALLVWAEGQLDGDGRETGTVEARHGPDETPVFYVRNLRAFVRDESTGVHVAVDARELRRAIAIFLDGLHERIARAHPDGERWWADAYERSVRAPSLFPGR
jgi:hypothetical protein